MRPDDYYLSTSTGQLGMTGWRLGRQNEIWSAPLTQIDDLAFRSGITEYAAPYPHSGQLTTDRISLHEPSVIAFWELKYSSTDSGLK